LATESGSPKEHIIVAAERLFAEHGVNGVSLRQIGAADGMVGFLEAPASPSTIDALDRSVATSATVRPVAR
jgi:hypothetical protein